MAVLPLIVAPDPRLKQPSEHVSEVNEEIRQLVNDMIETMYQKDGIGLAAVQIGVHKKVVVIDVEWGTKDKNPIVMINPEIIEFSEEKTALNEGCMSFPNQYPSVIRPSTVTVKYKDLEWQEHIIQAEGLFAKCIQHEIDHTNGITFVDHIPQLKRKIILDKLLRLKINKA
ncbi:MAG: peptide deformylase [Sphingobacteriia bacterium]|nr:peptide deformylase [Sphingobacteriia bacterium]